MELLKEIASVSGKPGLFKILKPTRNGVILETLDDLKNKSIVNTATKVSILKDISVYSTGEVENVPLGEVLLSFDKATTGNVPVSSKSDDAALRKFFGQILPTFDKERVYVSDIKKMVSWYLILKKYMPEIFVEQPAAGTTDKEAVEEPVKASAKEKTAKSATPKVAKPTSAPKPKSSPAVNKSATTRASKKGG
ncbi:MAG: DUF5606 domain-containing protein [Cytophagales bacterium]|nr:DUF5606 domain-containing protein [Cytophagales bacterium]